MTATGDAGRLVERVRAEHYQSEIVVDRAWCQTCLLTPWPCLPAMLADALEQTKAAQDGDADIACEVIDRWKAITERLAHDALAALSGARIATPVEGYVMSPTLLKGDIRRLAAERDAAQARADRLAGWAKKRGHQPECRASVRQRPNGDQFGSLGPCKCGLSAALGLAVEEGEG